MKVKEFLSNDYPDLDNTINDWIEMQDRIEIVDIKYVISTPEWERSSDRAALVLYIEHDPETLYNPTIEHGVHKPI